MTTAERRRKLAAVTRFERAVDALAFKGASHPDDHVDIERRYTLAKANLYRQLGFEVNLTW